MRTTTTSSVARRRGFRLTALCVLGVVCGVLLASQSLILVPGASRVLMYRGMKRVIVVDPAVADVVVGSRTELIVFGKALGVTKLYVWDGAGRHEYAVVVRGRPSADALVTRLRDFLPAYATVRVMDDRSILLEGVSPSQRDHAKVLDTSQKLAGEIKIVDLMQVEGEEISPAERAAGQLRRLLGTGYEYVVWGDATVLVKGPMDQETVDQITKLNEAMAGTVKIVALKALMGGAVPPTEEISQAIGKEYRVWTLGGNTVVVEGTAADQPALDRVKGLLAVFEKRAQIVNLVTLAMPPRPTAGEYAQMLREALTERTVNVRTIGESAVVVEGTVANDDALKGIESIIAAAGKDVRVINLVKVVVPEKRRVIFRVRVLDVDRDQTLKYGVDWGQIVGGKVQDQPIIVQAERLGRNIFPFGANIQALETDNRTRVLAQPNLVVNEGEEANMLVGGEIPIPVPQAGGTTGVTAITIEYKPFGVTLKMKPTITPEGMIQAKIMTEVSTVDYSVAISFGAGVIPGLKTRRAETLVTVAPGSTLVIGGLYREDEMKLVKAIPLISRVPIIGEFFKHTEKQRTKSELIILLTPEVMAEANQGAPQ
jgi:Flp pilus assembly secretin CpaC